MPMDSEDVMKRGPVVFLVAAIVIFSAVWFIKTSCISSGRAYAPERSVSESLGAEKIRGEGGRTWFGRAWKERRNGNLVVSMSGDPYEMGFQHGTLLRDEIARGVVPVFADPVTNTRDYRARPAFLRKLMLAYLDFSIFGPLEKNTPAEYLRELKGIADGSGIDYRDLVRATYKSELTMIMVPKVIKGKVKSLGIAAECSDFAAAGPATTDGTLIVGRNTD